MIFKWTPAGVYNEAGDDVAENFEGHVKIEVKTKAERLRTATALQTELKGGEIGLDTLAKLDKTDAILADAVKEVRLKTKCGHVINSLDDLECFQEGILISQHLLGIAVNGLSLGKPQRPASAPPLDTSTEALD
jgi:hypothetical protein